MTEHDAPDLDERAQTSRALFELAARVLDPGTRRRIEALGIQPGWSCFEPGCGAGSVARWLCDRVGPTGRVVALDIDTRLIASAPPQNLEVRQEDLAAAALPEAEFDLVSTRSVLRQLPQRNELIRRLAASLKPSGWLLVEEQDWFSLQETPYPLARRAWSMLSTIERARGAELGWARQIPRLMQQAGLVDVEAEVSSFLSAGGTPETELWLGSLKALEADLVRLGLFGSAEMRAFEALLSDPEKWFYGPSVIAVRGRMPG